MLPASHAFHFLLFCTRNAKPCPVLDVLEAGVTAPAIAEEADLRDDLPRYRIFEKGPVLDVLATELQRRSHERA